MAAETVSFFEVRLLSLTGQFPKCVEFLNVHCTFQFDYTKNETSRGAASETKLWRARIRVRSTFMSVVYPLRQYPGHRNPATEKKAPIFEPGIFPQPQSPCNDHVVSSSIAQDIL